MGEQKISIQNRVFRQKMQLKQQQKNKAPNAQNFGNGLNSGFLQNKNQNKNKKLTKKEKAELRKQKKAMMKNGSSQPTMQQESIQSNNTQTQPIRRKKGKHRFAKG